MYSLLAAELAHLVLASRLCLCMGFVAARPADSCLQRPAAMRQAASKIRWCRTACNQPELLQHSPAAAAAQGAPCTGCDAHQHAGVLPFQHPETYCSAAAHASYAHSLHQPLKQLSFTCSSLPAGAAAANASPACRTPCSNQLH
jgi:hypothetical protein